MSRLALSLGDLATRILPSGRKGWGEAMKAELIHIDDERSAVAHARGCLIAAVRERALDFHTRFAAGIWGVALVSGAFAFFHLKCASRGVDVLLGARDDGFLETLRHSGRADAELVAAYQNAMPVVIACFFCLGAAHLAAAWFLFRMQLRRFLWAWCAALLVATAAVAIQLSIVWSPDGLPSEFFALLVQAVALPALLFWSGGRHLRLRRTG